MGNLGAYQDIVTNAKAAGGVEKLIVSIEKSAAAKAMPKAFAAGVAVSALAAAGVTAIVKQVSQRTETREAEAHEAKAQLTAELGDLSLPDGFSSDDSEPVNERGLAEPPESGTPE